MPKYRDVHGVIITANEPGYGIVNPGTGWTLVDAPANNPPPAQNPPVVTSTGSTRSTLDTELDNSLKELDTMRQRIAEQRESSIRDINAAADEQKRQTETIQQRQTGQRSLLLAGAGAIGRTVSGQDNLFQMERAHKQEIDALYSKRQALISQAQSAYNDKDFSLLQYKISQIRQSRKEEAEALQKINTEKRAAAAEARSQMTFEQAQRDKALATIRSTADALATGLVSDALEVPGDEEIDSLAQQYGIDPLYLTEAINKRIDAVRKIRVSEFKDYFNVAKDLNEGEELTAPDGTIIKGLKQNKADVLTYEANIGGLKYKVGVDKQTGKVLWQNAVGAGSGSGNGRVGKTVTWAMAKELGDLSLYGQPVAEIYKKPEELTYEDWISMKNAEDPENYPLISSPDLAEEYFQYLDSLQAPAENLEENLQIKNKPQSEKEQYALDLIELNSDASDEELIQAIIEDTGLTYAQAKKVVDNRTMSTQ